jgi:hypothetical protein
MQKYSRQRSSLRPAEAAPSLRTRRSRRRTRRFSHTRALPVAHSSYAMHTRYRTSLSPAKSGRLAVLRRSVVIAGRAPPSNERRQADDDTTRPISSAFARPVVSTRMKKKSPRRSPGRRGKDVGPRRYAAPSKGGGGVRALNDQQSKKEYAESGSRGRPSRTMVLERALSLSRVSLTQNKRV